MKVTLYQRGGVWWGRKMIEGKTYYFSCGTADRCEARIVAQGKLLEILKGEKEVKTRKPKKVTVKAVYDAWEAQAGGLAESTRKLTRNALSLYLGSIGADMGDSIEEVFSGHSLRSFQRIEVGDLKGIKKQQRTRTVNSVSRTLRSMFSPRYDYGRPLPESIEEFRSAPLLKEARVTYRVDKRKDAIRKAIDGLPSLLEQDQNAYLMGWLCLHAGLRRNEAACARWEWVSDSGITVDSTEEFTPKSGQSRLIPLSAANIAHLRAFQGEGDTILAGDHNARYRAAGDVLSRFLRGCGFDGIKTIHELRYHFGAQVATKLGLYQAQRYLGHSEPGVTARYYADLVESKPVDIG